MVGEWFMNRGPLVDIPANGGAVFCGGGQSLKDGCVSGLRPLNGGIPAAGTVVTPMGSAPASFTIPTGAFALAGGPANRQTVPVPGIPTVVQLASQFSLAAPQASSLNNGATVAAAPPGGAATFQANAWQNDPVQTMGGPAPITGGGGGVPRLAANFTWCPPAGTCGTTLGAFDASIKYTAGANGFGGTMNMMLRDTGVVSILVGGGQVLHQLVGGTSNPDFGKQAAGGGYANFRALTLADGPVHATFMTSTPCTSGFGQAPSPAGCGIIVSQGIQIGTQAGSMNYDWGMPWTTGTVQAQNLAGPLPSQDPATNLTAMGTDSRTALGAGRITMVAGATTERTPTGNHFSALEVLTLNFGTAVPLMSWPSLAVMLSLVTLAGGYMARKRFADDQI
jgi:hypothetical protein